jgi:exosortase/archaeosortase family protein
MAPSKSESCLEKLGQSLHQRSRQLLRTSVKTNHNRIVTCGCIALLFFVLTWLGLLWRETLNGSSATLLNLGFLYLGLDRFWQHRHQLTAEAPPDEERITGYLLIFGSAACFPFFLTSSSLQAALCMLILLGIAVCNWGITAIQKHPLATALILISAYPDLTFLVNSIRKTLTGDQLERVMAWLTSIAFSLIGQPVSVQGPLLSLSQNLDPHKAVEVASGCSGFDMAFPIAGFAFMMGLYLKQTWQKTALLIVIGIILALVFNIPRIMLLAYAVVYWSKSSFEFWHGPIGGQIFAGILFTVYYYAAMAIINHKAQKNEP